VIATASVVGFIPFSPSKFSAPGSVPKHGPETLTETQVKLAAEEGAQRSAVGFIPCFLLVLLRRPPAKRALLYHKLRLELSRNPLILEADISGQAVLIGRVVLAADQRRR
jgi:hypothetical protein